MGAPPKPEHVRRSLEIQVAVPTSHEESEDNELAHVRCNCRGDREDDKEEIAAMIQGQAPVHFG
jgi:hypothetical protein